MTQQQPRKPLPRPTPETQPYWDGCKRHELLLPRCLDCGRFHFYPRALCPHCWSRNLEWVKATGRGKLYSYVINHRPAPGFEQDAPYVIAVVELDEGVRLMSNIVGVEPDPAKLPLDMPLEAVFEDISPEVSLPKFRPARP
ncbi:MAG: Zn-ribbon domain-containing OB-fold protein [Chloroflexi bacterium]|nr:Zn-ribbon domain-containing OB-fold protein [Chloroflexota bacterium]